MFHERVPQNEPLVVPINIYQPLQVQTISFCMVMGQNWVPHVEILHISKPWLALLFLSVCDAVVNRIHLLVRICPVDPDSYFASQRHLRKKHFVLSLFILRSPGPPGPAYSYSTRDEMTVIVNQTGIGT